MHVACRHSEQWLRQTIRALLVPTVRHVSTSSAINRGLNETKRAGGDDRRENHGTRRAAARAARRRGEDLPVSRPTGDDVNPTTRPGADQRGGQNHLRGVVNESRRGPADSAAGPLNRRIEGSGGRQSRRSDVGRPVAAPVKESPSTPKGSVTGRRQGVDGTRRQPIQWQMETGTHGMTPATLLLFLRRVRDLDRGLNIAWRGVHMGNLREAIAQVNRTPQLKERTQAELTSPSLERFGAVPGGPLVVHGDPPPVVTRTALWLKPDSTFALVFPQAQGMVTEEATPGLASTMKRVSFLIREVQRLEAGGAATPKPAPEVQELKRLIAHTNQALDEGRWDTPSVMRFVAGKLGDSGGLWRRHNKTKSPLSYLHVNPDAMLELVPRRPPAPDTPVSSNDENPEQPETTPTRTFTGLDRKLRKPQDSEQQQDDEIPMSIPYSTAASTFVYGSNAVLAALRARRRKLYHLYLHPRLSARESNAKQIADLAREHNIRTTHTLDLPLMDRMSSDRPHNGVVLEASRLPAPPLLSLSKPNRRTSVVPLVLDRQSSEDVDVNGAPAALPTLSQTWRHPFVLMLDGITDEGNVGNIMRTAHFYGVDAVVVATNTCAPLTSSILAKASSGACEALKLFALPRPSSFVYDSVRAGWHVYAAVAPNDQRPAELRRPRDYEQNVTTANLALDSPLARHPVILMLGAEGEGLRENLKRQATKFVTIGQGKRAFDVEEQADVGVDSLNVGVAAGVLVEAFMRKPEGAADLGNAGELGF